MDRITDTTTRPLGTGGCDWRGDRRWKTGELRPRMEDIYPVELTADQLAGAKARSQGDDEVFAVIRLLDLQHGELVSGMWPVSYHASAAGARADLEREGSRNMISLLVARPVDADGLLPESWRVIDETPRFRWSDVARHDAMRADLDVEWGVMDLDAVADLAR